jgi:hypothetical protein
MWFAASSAIIQATERWDAAYRFARLAGAFTGVIAIKKRMF